MQSGIFETWLLPERFEQVRRWQRKEKHYGVLFFFFFFSNGEKTRIAFRGSVDAGATDSSNLGDVGRALVILAFLLEGGQIGES